MPPSVPLVGLQRRRYGHQLHSAAWLVIAHKHDQSTILNPLQHGKVCRLRQPVWIQKRLLTHAWVTCYCSSDSSADARRVGTVVYSSMVAKQSSRSLQEPGSLAAAALWPQQAAQRSRHRQHEQVDGLHSLRRQIARPNRAQRSQMGMQLQADEWQATAGLPCGLESQCGQQEKGDVVPCTHSGGPTRPQCCWGHMCSRTQQPYTDRQTGRPCALLSGKQSGSTVPFTVQIHAEQAAMCHALITVAAGTSVTDYVPRTQQPCTHRQSCYVNGPNRPGLAALCLVLAVVASVVSTSNWHIQEAMQPLCLPWWPCLNLGCTWP